MKKHFLGAVAIISVIILCTTSLCRQKPNKQDKKGASMSSEIKILPSGLRYETLKESPVGSKKAKKGSVVSVHYSGYLNDGKDGLGSKFDSSLDRGQMFNFVLGGGQVIQGWDLGVAEMSEGQKIRLYIPSQLGYGARGAGRLIPPNADLIFDIELHKVH